MAKPKSRLIGENKADSETRSGAKATPSETFSLQESKKRMDLSGHARECQTQPG
jgi:hypothetical protein